MERLQDAGILSSSSDEESDKGLVGSVKKHGISTINQGREVIGNPWFEEMIEGSKMGRIKRRRGGQSSSDGRAHVEWEVVEYESEEGDGGSAGTGKRKLGSMHEEEDVKMQGH